MLDKNTLLPNFICVGAQKAGSSSLYKLLKSHPEVHVSEKKEIHFFNIEEEYNKGLSYYSSFFNENYRGQKIIGEFTPDYLQYDFVPERIKKDLGLIKILIILRHPVDRSYSQFNFHKMLKLENNKSDFETFLKNEVPVTKINERIEWYYPSYYLSKSLYYEQVKRYYEIFGKENVHVIIFEKMLKDRNITNLKSTCEFLGIDSSFSFQPNHSNPTLINFEEPHIKLMRKIKTIILPFIPNEIFNPLKNYLKKKIYKTPEKLKSKLKKELFNTYFSEDVEKLEELTQLDLSIWK